MPFYLFPYFLLLVVLSPKALAKVSRTVRLAPLWCPWALWSWDLAPTGGNHTVERSHSSPSPRWLCEITNYKNLPHLTVFYITTHQSLHCTGYSGDMVNNQKCVVSDYPEIISTFWRQNEILFLPPPILMEDTVAEILFFQVQWDFFLLLEAKPGVWFVMHLPIVGTLWVATYI